MIDYIPVAVTGVSFSYQEETEFGTICDMNFQITKGECVLLCGKSGCGKSTMIKLINGLIPHFENGEKSGTVYIDGTDIDELEPYQISEKIASVFQNPKSQFFNIEPESEITFTMENQGVKLDIIEKRLQATIAELEIGHLMNKTMFGMSGGEKQIIAMACAYATDTPIVILDEPSANLDERATNTIAKIISKMKSSGKTVVIAEHRVAYLKGIADRAVLVENGRILDILTADAFYNKDEQWRKTHGLRQLKSNSYFPEISAPRLASESAKKQLSVKGLALSHEKQIIASDICFDIFSGEIVALMGENGAGKTTLSRCLCGLFSEDSGDITFNGKPLTAKQRRKAAYMVMQDVNHQLFSQSVLDECALGNDETTRDDIVCMLNKFGLSEYLNAHPQTLSCGQKQRLAVAVAMLSGKEILIFDEPTSGLDYENMYSISQTMKEIARRGHMVLVITHDTELIEAACTRCVQLAPTGILEVSTTHVNPSTIIE